MKKKFSLLTVTLFFVFSLQPLQAQDGISSDSSNYKSKKTGWYKPFIIPALLTGTGIYLNCDNRFISRYEVRDYRNEHFNDFHTKADDILQFAPFAVAGIIELTERNSTPVIKQRFINLVKTEALMGIIVYTIKNTTKVKRPDSGAHNSFPSGHTAQAFAAATFLYREYCDDHSKWIGAGGFAIAATVGVLRIMNNRHWISDVAAGAGIGMLSAELGCLNWGENKNDETTLILPVFSKDFAGIAMIKSF